MPTAYDEVAYPAYSFAQTHPDRLATLGILFGMTPAAVEKCRVLELGCGAGANLIPMAFSLPGSRFVGVDLAASQIEIGCDQIKALGLDNIELLPLDCLRIDRDFGEFDYIIAHGLYSWVPAEVRDKALAICSENLAPSGVAYMSYNTYPGAHLRRMVREILLQHVRGISEPAERVREALCLARYISNWQHDEDNERTLMRAEFQRVLGYDTGHFFHDDLGEINEPVYFRDFVAHAARHGLQYLAEADFYEMQPPPRQPDGANGPQLPAQDDIVESEQYIDFLRCRRFRQTLLCHAAVRLDREIAPSRLRGLYVASPLRPESGAPDMDYGKVETYVGPKQSNVATDFPATKAALAVLSGIWPASVRFEELLKRSRALAAQGTTNGDDWPEQIGRELAGMLLKMYAASVVELSAGAPRFTVDVNRTPECSRLARLQLQSGGAVTNQKHRLVDIPEQKARQLLVLADGTRDLDELRQELSSRLGAGIEEADLMRGLKGAAEMALLVR